MSGQVLATHIKSKSITADDISDSAQLTPEMHARRALNALPLSLTDLRKWDALEQILPFTPATTYLGLASGTYGSSPPQAATGDCKATTTTRRARLLVALPDNYVADGGCQIRAIAGMKTTVADTSATILVEAYQLNDDGTLSANLVSTGALSINSLTLASKDFVLDPSTLSPGDRLDVRVSIAIVDAASATAVIGVLHALKLRCDLQP